ncbi:MAG: hypothetical protein J6B72_03465 [Clostridia bacterium]|nr:hypothetical protein [Clostridia bacterium]
MKNVSSILLICAMLLFFGIPIAAEDGELQTSYTVTQRSGLTELLMAAQHTQSAFPKRVPLHSHNNEIN